MIGLYSFLPCAKVVATTGIPEAELLPIQMPVFFTVALLTAALLFLAIFMFRNMSRQKSVVRLSCGLILVLALEACCVIYDWASSEPKGLDWTWTWILLCGALLCSILALGGIAHDQRLLRAADRLR